MCRMLGHHHCSRRPLQHVQQSSVAQLAWLYSILRSLALLDYCNWALKVCETSSDSNLVGDHPWLWGTTYGTVNSLAGQSMAAINSPGRPSTATKFAADGLAGPVEGGPSVA